jgi:hypothetical protein
MTLIASVKLLQQVSDSTRINLKNHAWNFSIEKLQLNYYMSAANEATRHCLFFGNPIVHSAK